MAFHPAPHERVLRDEREASFGRIGALSDGIFSIAATLLVLSISVPAGGDDLTGALWDRREEALSFVLSFAVIGRMWLLHHRLLGDMNGYTPRFLTLNLVFLGLVSFVPYPTEVLGEYSGETASTVLYAVTLAAVSALNVVLRDYAGRAGLLKEGKDEQAAAYYRIPVVFAVSAPLALVSVRAAHVSWLVLLLVHPGTIRRLRGRHRAAPP